MFESDDFDQVLSQFELPDVLESVENKKDSILLKQPYKEDNNSTKKSDNRLPIIPKSDLLHNINVNESNTGDKINQNHKNTLTSTVDFIVSPKQNKRKIINSYFDHQSKRKFPGPAGLLTGALEEPKDESICQIELLSQDVDYSANNLRKDLFDSPIWKRLLHDAECWALLDIDTIKAIKMQAVAGNLRKRKAQTVTAFVEAVDRSATDPLIILRDSSGSIKCTLHRDAWSTFSSYIMSEFCALVLQKPTVLTTGSAFKKHYLNITLSNIYAVYSSTVLEDGTKTLPEGYSVVYAEDFTVIKSEKTPFSSEISMGQSKNAEDFIEGLDSFFYDDMF